MTAVVLLVSLLGTMLVAWADAPDPVLPMQGSQVVNPDGSITLTISGGWEWPTHRSDCNTNRYAVGWAIDWNDPNQPGNIVGQANNTGPIIDVGALAANQYNPADNATHFYTGPNPPRCGVFDPQLGYNTGNWGPMSHTDAPGTTEVAPCAVMYDIHGDTSPDPKDLIAGGPGHAPDNSVEKNDNTPLGNGCFTRNFPILTTTASGSVSLGGGTVSDTAHLTGGNNPTGTITFKLYGPDDATCSGAAVFSPPAVAVNGNGNYTSAAFTPTANGVYRWTASYSGDVNNSPASSPCNAPNESVEVKPRPEARIKIDPAEGANQVGQDHQLTVTVTKKGAGDAGFVPAANAAVTLTKVSGPGGFKNGVNTCTTSASGLCTVVLVSGDTGLATVSASANVPVDGQSISVQTNAQNGNSGPAVKRWVDARLVLTPPKDANHVNDTHTFTANLQFDRGDGGGFLDAPAGETISFTKTGPGTLAASTCTTGAAGTCTVNLISAVTGLSTVNASWSGTITTAEGVATATTSSTDALKRWANSKLTLTPATDANQVGDTHRFTADLEFDRGDGNGFVNAPAGETISFTRTGVGSLAANTCTTGANGTCTVDLTSTVTGLSSVKASWAGTIGTAEGAAVASTASTDAVKRWVDADLSLTPPEAANQVGDTHTFTAHLRFDLGNGGGFVNAPAGETISFTRTGAGSLSANTCTTAANGTCTVDLTSTVTGLSTVKATWAGTIGTAEGAAVASTASGDALKRWVDADLSLTPPEAANRVGDTHTFTAHLRFDLGNGGGFVNAPAGQTISFTKVSGPGALSANTCTTGAGGTCSVDLDSAVTGLTTVNAGWSGQIATAEGQASATTASPNAVKRWVDARLQVTPPTAVNRIGDTHTFTAQLQFDRGNGNGFVAAPAGATINFTKSGPGTLSASSCTTGAGGTCTVDLVSAVTGTTTLNASWDGNVATAEGTVQADASASAEKHWVDALITINPPEATNRIGDDHVFTIKVMRTQGGASSPASGVDVDASITSGPGSFVGDDTCTTNAGGECSVTIRSTTPGLTVVEAEAVVTVDGLPVTVRTDGQGGNAPPAEKRWVDARLSVTPPQDTNIIGDTHTFTAHLELDLGDGNGFVGAGAGEVITFSKLSGPGTFAADSCTTGNAGTCTVELESGDTGLSTVRAAWTGAITAAEGTTQVSIQSNSAVKRWVDARISVDPPQATNVVGDTHTFTGHLEFDLGDGNGFVDGPAGEAITWSKVSGPGSFASDTCTTGAGGTCTAQLDSDEVGQTTVRASWAGDVTAAEGSASATRSNTAGKTWVQPGIQIVKTASPEAGPPRDVTFTYVVTNTGDVTLTNVSVTDDILGSIGTIPVLEPGQSVTLTKDQAVDAQSPTRNVGTACGAPTANGQVIGAEICDDDDAVISVVLGTRVSRLPRTGLAVRGLVLFAALLTWLGAAFLAVENRRIVVRRRRA